MCKRKCYNHHPHRCPEICKLSGDQCPDHFPTVCPERCQFTINHFREDIQQYSKRFARYLYPDDIIEWGWIAVLWEKGSVVIKVVKKFPIEPGISFSGNPELFDNFENLLEEMHHFTKKNAAKHARSILNDMYRLSRFISRGEQFNSSNWYGKFPTRTLR